MIELVKLEWKKNNISRYIRNGIIAFILIDFLTLITAKDFTIESTSNIYNGNMIYTLVNIFSNMVFIVFSAVMFSTTIVNTYKNGIMQLMFTYPIPRKKILFSQIIAVWLFNSIALIMSKVLIYISIFAISPFIKMSLEDIPITSISFYTNIIIGSLLMISISIITLFIGVLMKSSKATIISSIILVCLTQGNFGEYTLVNNLVFYGILFIISILSIYLTLHNIEKRDLV